MRHVAIAAVCLSCLGTGAAQAQGTTLLESVLELRNGFAVGAGTFDDGWYTVGQNLHLYGVVTTFRAPLDVLVKPGEYTYAVTGLTADANGVWDNFTEGRGGPYTEFGAAVFRVYHDPTPDAAFGSVDTHLDGEVVLEGLVPYMMIRFGTAEGEENQDSSVTFRAGSWYGDVSSDSGGGYLGIFRGRFTPETPEGEKDQRIVGRTEMDLNLLVPTAVETLSWSRLRLRGR